MSFAEFFTEHDILINACIIRKSKCSRVSK